MFLQRAIQLVSDGKIEDNDTIKLVTTNGATVSIDAVFDALREPDERQKAPRKQREAEQEQRERRTVERLKRQKKAVEKEQERHRKTAEKKQEAMREGAENEDKALQKPRLQRLTVGESLEESRQLRQSKARKRASLRLLQDL